jgi:uncharacterized protein YwgA
MDKMKRAAIVTKLVYELGQQGSWCGETHVQKSTFFLQDLTEIPLGLDFIMYKHGPYSFDLRAALVEHRADQLLDLESREFPYGPSLRTTDGTKVFWDLFPRTLGKHKAAIEFIAKNLGDKKVVELEQLATALFVLKESKERSSEILTSRMIELKPHISPEAAREAIDAVRKMRADWSKHK